MPMFAVLTLLVTLAAVFGFVSYRVLRLPTTVGTTIMALLLSTALLVAESMGLPLAHAATALVHGLDFSHIVLHGLLAFLLFAGALHLDLKTLTHEKLPVAALSVIGTVLSTGLVAGLLWMLLRLLGLHPGLLFCLLFGALISPTDPIAVLEMLRRVGAPAALQTRLAGESLFNDGVGAVLFLGLLDASATGRLPTPAGFLWLLLLQAGGGIALGLAFGYLVYRMLKSVDSYRVEVTLTLALAMGSYAVADVLHLSAPLAAIAAGLVVNGHARRFAMSAKTLHNVETFWDLVDEILNVVLFLLIGLELMVITLHGRFLLAGALAIPAVLLCRFISVGAVMAGVGLCRPGEPRAVGVLTWGGLRGGLSVALALGLPPGPNHDLALTMTYMVVIFSIVVQGLTVGRLLERTRRASTPEMTAIAH